MRNKEINNLSLKTMALFLFFVTVGSEGARSEVKQGLQNESEAGLVIVGGNQKNETYTFKQTSTYGFDENILRFNGRYLRTEANNTETARNWGLGLRYERALSPVFNIYVGQGVEANIFANLLQRYNTDIGGKYIITDDKDAGFYWASEGGYRYTYENFLGNVRKVSHYLRLFSEATKQWTPTFSTKLWIEGLPNLSDSADYLINSELSLIATLSEFFSLKSGYLINYDNKPAPGASFKTDTTFTTSLIAKF